MKVTMSVIKADVGSIGGHTMPSKGMLDKVNGMVDDALKSGLLIDGMVTYTGDDIAILMSHTHGEGAEPVHEFAWSCFKSAADVAAEEGNYGAGQDLLVDAPSGNVRGAGPAVAEIEFDLLPEHRPAEAFMVFAADKCAPGAYNLPLIPDVLRPDAQRRAAAQPSPAQGIHVYGHRHGLRLTRHRPRDNARRA